MLLRKSGVGNLQVVEFDSSLPKDSKVEESFMEVVGVMVGVQSDTVDANAVKDLERCKYVCRGQVIDKDFRTSTS